MKTIQEYAIPLCWLIFMAYYWINARSVKATAESQGWATQLVQMIPLSLGVILLFLRFTPSHRLGLVVIPRTPLSASAGAALCVLGLTGAIWARRTLAGNWSGIVTLKKGHELVKTGPYRHARHPIYTSLLLMCLGTALESGRSGAFVGVLLFFVGFGIKIRQEEALLLRHFPEEYAAYRAEVKALIPFIF